MRQKPLILWILQGSPHSLCSQCWIFGRPYAYIYVKITIVTGEYVTSWSLKTLGFPLAKDTSHSRGTARRWSAPVGPSQKCAGCPVRLSPLLLNGNHLVHTCACGIIQWYTSFPNPFVLMSGIAALACHGPHPKYQKALLAARLGSEQQPMLRTLLGMFARTKCLGHRWKLFWFVGANAKLYLYYIKKTMSAESPNDSK